MFRFNHKSIVYGFALVGAALVLPSCSSDTNTFAPPSSTIEVAPPSTSSSTQESTPSNSDWDLTDKEIADCDTVGEAGMMCWAVLGHNDPAKRLEGFVDRYCEGLIVYKNGSGAEWRIEWTPEVKVVNGGMTNYVASAQAYFEEQAKVGKFPVGTPLDFRTAIGGRCISN